MRRYKLKHVARTKGLSLYDLLDEAGKQAGSLEKVVKDTVFNYNEVPKKNYAQSYDHFTYDFSYSDFTFP